MNLVIKLQCSLCRGQLGRMDWLSSVSRLKNQLSELDCRYRLYAEVNILWLKLYNKAERKNQMLCSNTVTEIQTMATNDYCCVGKSASIWEDMGMTCIIYPIEFKYYISSIDIDIYHVSRGKSSTRCSIHNVSYHCVNLYTLMLSKSCVF